MIDHDDEDDDDKAPFTFAVHQPRSSTGRCRGSCSISTKPSCGGAVSKKPSRAIAIVPRRCQIYRNALLGHWTGIGLENIRCRVYDGGSIVGEFEHDYSSSDCVVPCDSALMCCAWDCAALEAAIAYDFNNSTTSTDDQTTSLLIESEETCFHFVGSDTTTFDSFGSDTYCESVSWADFTYSQCEAFAFPIDETDPNPPEPGNPSWEACNSNTKRWSNDELLKQYNPTCVCEKQGNGNYRLQCEGSAATCAIHFRTPFYTTKLGCKQQCISLGGSACICSGVDSCSVDCSAIELGVQFNQCTGDGSFGSYAEYSNIYKAVYVASEELDFYPGNCEDKSVVVPNNSNENSGKTALIGSWWEISVVLLFSFL